MVQIKQERLHLVGLDALRGLCALVVVFGHMGLQSNGGSTLTRLSHVAFHAVANGPAAVMVFFVISGLCIHLPQAGGRSLDTPIFYGRRLLRIGTPMLFGWLLARVFLSGSGHFSGVMWSLVAELIYYAIYPVLLAVRKRWSWKPLLLVSLVVSFVLLIVNRSAEDVDSFGYTQTWLLFLPIWLLGCVLAESLYRTRTLPSSPWPRRLTVAGASLAMIYFRWHLVRFHISYPFSMLAFGLVAWNWLGSELTWMRTHPPMPIWDRLGAASYSLYLVHTTVIDLAWHSQQKWNLPDSIIRVSAVVGSLGAAWLFYLVVENPSHKLASTIRRVKTD